MYLFGVGTSSFGPLEPSSAPSIPQTKALKQKINVLSRAVGTKTGEPVI